MEKESIKKLTWTFESFVNKMENWIEFWFARDLQNLLWYKKWDNFLNVIWKAKIAGPISAAKAIRIAPVSTTINVCVAETAKAKEIM